MIDQEYCRNPSLGLATKARDYKVAGQKGSPRVTSHAPGRAKKCEDCNQFEEIYVIENETSEACNINKICYEIISPKMIRAIMATCIATIVIYNHMVMIQVQIGSNVAWMMFLWIGG